ncbi:MAG: hypothetical protein QF714_01565, partial [Dehalococcoidia bacterium]|nr:hypothetical protein [Dehalococcoidia bacterium]
VQDCSELGIVDQAVPEPEGGSHTNPREAASVMQLAVVKQIAELSKLSPSKLLKRRYQKYRRMGERSAFSQEAMSLEVELLINIAAHGQRQGRAVRAQKVKAPEGEPIEALATAAEET